MCDLCNTRPEEPTEAETRERLRAIGTRLQTAQGPARDHLLALVDDLLGEESDADTDLDLAWETAHRLD